MKFRLFSMVLELWASCPPFGSTWKMMTSGLICWQLSFLLSNALCSIQSSRGRRFALVLLVGLDVVHQQEERVLELHCMMLLSSDVVFCSFLSSILYSRLFFSLTFSITLLMSTISVSSSITAVRKEERFLLGLLTFVRCFVLPPCLNLRGSKWVPFPGHGLL